MMKRSTMHLSPKAVWFAETDDTVQEISFVFSNKQIRTCIKVMSHAQIFYTFLSSFFEDLNQLV